MSNYSCQFCYRRTTLGYIKNYFPSETNIHQIIRHTLYHKYATSQNYYFTKDINEILGKTTSNRTILYQDYLCYDEEDEYLKRFYEMHEYSHKSQLLTEFYKFHRDLPRWVVKKQILKTLNYYYDKRRKIEFYKIQRQIEIENQLNPTDPPKGIIGERPHLSDSTPQSENSEPQSKVNVDNILEGISFSNKKQQTSQELSKIVQIPECSLGDIQQIINLFTQKPDSPIQKQQYQWFNKRKIQSKKSLKLDELALSLSARTHQNPQEAKMPLSARYQQSCSNRLIDQIQIKLQNKQQSTNFTKEKIQEFKQNKDLFIKKLKLEEKSRKSASPKKDQNKSMQNKINKEIKQLELKIIKSLQEMKNIKNSSHSNQDQKQNSISLSQNNQISSLDQRALHQMLKSPDSFHQQQQNQQFSLKQQSNSTNSRAVQKQSSDLVQKTQKQNTLQWKQKQVQVLDMKKIITNKKDIAPQTERVKKTIPALNLNLIGTINQSASMTTRNNSFAPNLAYASVLTPKQNQININENNLNNLLRENHFQK